MMPNPHHKGTKITQRHTKTSITAEIAVLDYPTEHMVEIQSLCLFV